MNEMSKIKNIAFDGQLRELEQERQSIERASQFHWVHWLVVLGSLLITLSAWWISSKQQQEKNNARFKVAAHHVGQLIIERFEKYEVALWSGVAAIESHEGCMSWKHWKLFADRLKIDQMYPGINGIGVIWKIKENQTQITEDYFHHERPDFKIFPDHHRPDKFPIVYIEPEDINAKAIGLDIAYEMHRFEAAVKANQEKTAQITGPITLVQDNDQTPGFLFYAPYYQDHSRRPSDHMPFMADGWVYAPFIVKKLLIGALAPEKRDVKVRISDAGKIIYDEISTQTSLTLPSSEYFQKDTLQIYGRKWVIDILAKPSFFHNVQSKQPAIILVTGILIDTLLIILFLATSASNRRAIDFVNRVTQRLQKRTHELEQSNLELERFAYIASHDLKSPLRGMSNLIDFLNEDLQFYLKTEESKKEIDLHITRLKQQSQRMMNLIKGILEYAGISKTKRLPEEINVEKVIQECFNDLQINETHYVIEGPHIQFNGDSTLFTQVVANLVTNAVKYHHNPEQLKVVLTTQKTTDGFRMSIKDNGPGIEEEYHQLIFEPFQTLQPRDVIEGAGIGLSIVRKIIRGIGGELTLKSSPGQGSEFIFDWKISRSDNE